MSLINTMTIQPVALNPLTLRAFHPAPESGTLYGPTMEVTLGDPQATRLITDGGASADVELCTALVIDEAQRLALHYREQRIKPPWPIPSQNQQGTPWFLNGFSQGASRGAAYLFSPDPHRALDIDLSTAGMSIYTYKILCEAGEAIQSIVVSGSQSVETNYYAFRVRARSARIGLNLALGLATEIYRSVQYHAVDELGPLMYRQRDEEDWRTVPSTKRGFRRPRLDPTANGNLMLASARAVFEADGFAQPVAGVESRPSIDGDPSYQVEVCLHRPPDRVSKLMPLTDRLQQILWTPIFQSIFRR